MAYAVTLSIRPELPALRDRSANTDGTAWTHGCPSSIPEPGLGLDAADPAIHSMRLRSDSIHWSSPINRPSSINSRTRFDVSSDLSP